MRIADAQWVPTAPHQTWAALNNPEVLKKCIPGCVNLERRSATEYWVTLQNKCGGFNTQYEGEMLLSDIDAPNSCTLAFEGKGAASGMAIGAAQVNLTPKDGGTRLSYTVAAMAGGKLGQLGDAVLLKAGNKIVDTFFTGFVSWACAQPHERPPTPEAPRELSVRNSPVWSWAIAAAVVLAFTGYHTLFH